jgi:hypothetical protein
VLCVASCRIGLECFLTGHLGGNDSCHLTTYVDDDEIVIRVDIFRPCVKLERSMRTFCNKKEQ